jgi:transcriptional regulator with XRE-family HTH domain
MMDKEKIIDGAAQHLDGTNFNELDLRRIRKAKRMTQDEVGILAGISRNYVAQIEAGRYNTATLKTLRKVLAVYGKELVITVKDE